MFEEIAFSREAKLVYAEAADIARHASKPLDSTHLVLAIFYVPCEAQSILLEKRADCDRVLNALDGLAPEPNETVGAIYQTAAQIAGNVGSRQVTSVHLLMAISRVPSSRAARMLEKAGLPLFAIRTQAMAHLTDPRLKRAAAERLVANGNGLGVQVPAPVPMHVPAMPPPRPSLTPASAGPALAAPASSPRRVPRRPLAPRTRTAATRWTPPTSRRWSRWAAT